MKLKVFAATALLVCYRSIGDLQAAENVVERMMRRNIYPSVVTYTELVLGYAWKGEMDKAEEVVARMKWALSAARAQSCEGTYTALMEGYANAGDMGSMIEALMRMQRDNIRPGDRTYSVLINACGNSVRDAHQWFCEMKERGCAPTAWTYKARALVLGRAGRTGADMEALMEEVQREKDLRRL
jgi:pentatricopeptide repeat protein